MNTKRLNELRQVTPTSSVAARITVQTAHMDRAEFEALVRQLLSKQAAQKGTRP